MLFKRQNSRKSELMHKISNQELQSINLLEENTGARAKDVIAFEDSIVFVVEKGDLGRAIGRNGNNIQKLRRAFDKNVEVVEDAEDVKQFAQNVFYPAKVIEAKQSNDKKTLLVKVENKDRGIAIGKGGERIKRAKTLFERHFQIDDVKIV